MKTRIARTFDQSSQAQKILRWQNVLRVLNALTPHERKKHFDMGSWGQKTECGTVACAAGHCGLDPWFRRQGFKMNFKTLHGRDYTGGKTKDIISVFPERNPNQFFGNRGMQAVFVNGAIETVPEAIEATKAYIAELQGA